MSEFEILGRAVARDFDDRNAAPIGRGDTRPVSQRAELSLCEAAEVTRVSVDELKRAIRAGELRAERRGWVRIHRGDLNEYLHRL